MKKIRTSKPILFIIIAFIPLLFSCSCSFNQCFHENIKTDIIDPSCDSPGEARTVCFDCGESYLSDVTLPMGHQFDVKEVPPSCDELGYELYSCKNCELEYKANYTSPLGHTLSVNEVLPTCDLEGYKLADCQICGYSYTFDVVAPTGHDFDAISIPISARNQLGSTTYVCDCGFSYVGDYRFYSDIFKGAYVDDTEILAKGLDVSYHNHNLAADGVSRLALDWEAISDAGYEFAILRAGYRNKADVTFESNYTLAKAAGLEVGAYFYSYAASVEEARAEALFCINLLEGKQFEYPIFFDIEDSTLSSLGKETLTQICITFISTLQENGYYAALYTNNNWLVNLLQTQKITALFDVWYARYPSISGIVNEAQWDSEKYGKQMALWQFSQTGVIDGIERPDGTPVYFDLNYAYRDSPTLIKSLGYNGY